MGRVRVMASREVILGILEDPKHNGALQKNSTVETLGHVALIDSEPPHAPLECHKIAVVPPLPLNRAMRGATNIEDEFGVRVEVSPALSQRSSKAVRALHSPLSQGSQGEMSELRLGAPAAAVVPAETADVGGPPPVVVADPREQTAIVSWIGCEIPVISNRDFYTASQSRLEPAETAGAEAEAVWGAVSVGPLEAVLGLNLPSARSGYVRGQVITSGWHIKPLPGVGPRASCGVTFVSVSQMNGQIPAMLLKMGNKEAGEMAGRLKKVAESVPLGS